MSKDALEQFKLKALVDYFYFVLPKSKKKTAGEISFLIAF